MLAINKSGARLSAATWMVLEAIMLGEIAAENDNIGATSLICGLTNKLMNKMEIDHRHRKHTNQGGMGRWGKGIWAVIN